ncbi:hypothetical protein CDAR_607981 [Caerostris darwini]|uniref:Uncharacterized protein n=1 Tax=Caerostris darwini TaxID=1538125 RepID=A0AAV4UKZ6_9ARAC|nr:hypothetical protein CDAR_607981 [Caerostris darwini]
MLSSSLMVNKRLLPHPPALSELSRAGSAPCPLSHGPNLPICSQNGSNAFAGLIAHSDFSSTSLVVLALRLLLLLLLLLWISVNKWIRRALVKVK